MNILIIEDEKAAIRNLTVILSEILPEAKIIATLDSISETIEWFNEQNNPDLVFMDIHLADGSAFEIFQHTQINCPVIFTTAYDEYALKAFKVNSVDYILKPIDTEDVRKSLAKLELFQRTNPSGETQVHLQGLLHSLKLQSGYKTHFLIPQKGDKLLPLAVDSVFYFYISEGLIKAVTDNKVFIVPQTLDELTESLHPNHFFRINRQFLIARKAIKDIDLWFNSRLSINLTIPAPEKIIISKVRVAEFKAWITR